MKPYLESKDFSVTKEQFQLLYDENLDMLVTKPQPKNLEKYYQSESYISHTDADKTLTDKIYQAVKKISLRKKVKLINAYAKTEKTLLDVGAGTGDFLMAASNENWKIDGVEPNHDAKQKAKEKGIEVFDDLKNLSNKKFNVITLWHVLEHLPNLDAQITKLISLLEEDGVLIIAVPNFKSYDAKHYKSFWAAFDVPRHLWHFSQTSIKKLFSKHQMKIIKTKPMVFDAFYVSLLSEKYKSSKQHFIKAFLVGLWSNINALYTKEYSSLIYILKKG